MKLVLSADSRFIDTVISSYTVRRCFKKCARDILGMCPFSLHIKGVGDVVDFKQIKRTRKCKKSIKMKKMNFSYCLIKQKEH